MKAILLSVVMFSLSSVVFALEPIKYLDENGEEQYISDYTILTGTETVLTRGWYVVKGDISYSNNKMIDVRGNVNIILMDDCECTVRRYGGFNGMDLKSRMNIYVQSHGEHEGRMTFDIEMYFCFYTWELNIYGGKFKIDGDRVECAALAANDMLLKNCTINIKSCNGLWVTNLILDSVDLTIDAKKTGIDLYGGSWIVKETDRTTTIKISSKSNSVDGTVELADGMSMTISDEAYTGSISSEVINQAIDIKVSHSTGDATDIQDVSHDVSHNNFGWYTLNGIRLNDKPTTAGIYIHDGRKVLVK